MGEEEEEMGGRPRREGEKGCEGNGIVQEKISTIS
jgi:hypothetical protein